MDGGDATGRTAGRTRGTRDFPLGDELSQRLEGCRDRDPMVDQADVAPTLPSAGTRIGRLTPQGEIGGFPVLCAAQSELPVSTYSAVIPVTELSCTLLSLHMCTDIRIKAQKGPRLSHDHAGYPYILTW